MPRLLVDSGSEYTWIPAKTLERVGVQREKKDLEFVMANGQVITRSVGFAIIRFDKYFTVDEGCVYREGRPIASGGKNVGRLESIGRFKEEKLAASGPILAA